MLLDWKPNEHNTDENVRWAWLRAIEWVNWPMFLSQSFVPLLLLFFPWKSVLLVLAVVNLIWNIVIGRNGILANITLASGGLWFTTLKWIICPATAIYFYIHGQTLNMWLALLWPGFITLASVLPLVNILMFVIMPPANIEAVQDKFMLAQGYVPPEQSPDAE